jgi:hypothetical protein
MVDSVKVNSDCIFGKISISFETNIRDCHPLFCS